MLRLGFNQIRISLSESKISPGLRGKIKNNGSGEIEKSLLFAAPLTANNSLEIMRIVMGNYYYFGSQLKIRLKHYDSHTLYAFLSKISIRQSMARTTAMQTETFTKLQAKYIKYENPSILEKSSPSVTVLIASA